MAKANTAPRSYRCYYTPKDRFGNLVATENGVLPFVQLKATDGERALRAAFHVTGCPVEGVERRESAGA